MAIIGGGPAGLMAAEALLQDGASVDLYDAMPSVGRKFLLAGKGGLNLTHSEPLDAFFKRYSDRTDQVRPWLEALSPQGLRDWAAGLGVETFIGSSGRVFPAEMKAAPLLRAWLQRLRAAGLRLHMRHRWCAWADAQSLPSTLGAAEAVPVAAKAASAAALGNAAAADLYAQAQGAAPAAVVPPPPAQLEPSATPPPALLFHTPHGEHTVRADAVLLALGGASWPQLGSNGAWLPWLAEQGVGIAPLRPANCGFDVGWSPYFAQRFAGAPVKSVRLSFVDGQGQRFDRPGEFVITASGIEGSLVYAASSLIREEIAARGRAMVALDLVPGRDTARLATALAKGRGARSLPNHLREQTGLEGAKAALLRERYSAETLSQRIAQAPAAFAAELKAWPLTLTAARPVAEAISTAGGVRFEAMNSHAMLTAMPGVFCAGEMLDWEAPTGGYLLTACMASGRVAGQGVLQWWREGGDTARDWA